MFRRDLATKSVVWDLPELRRYLSTSSGSDVEGPISESNSGRQLVVTLTAGQYSALSQHFYRVEGEPTILFPAPYQVQYAWICQSKHGGLTAKLSQDQRARDVYELTFTVMK